MKWIEIIKIQAASDQGTALENELTMLVHMVEKHADSQDLTKIGFYRHGTIPGCFAIHLRWESRSFERQGSKTALSLIQSLQRFGLIYHSVWIEKEEKQLWKL